MVQLSVLDLAYIGEGLKLRVMIKKHPRLWTVMYEVHPRRRNTWRLWAIGSSTDEQQLAEQPTG